MRVASNCKFYRGDIPCKPSKNYGVDCTDCSYFEEKKERILIIKLGAIGDVIRTTPLLRKIREQHPQAYIYWLTYSPEVLSSFWVDKILPVTVENLFWLETISFDWVINLDKDNIAVALAHKLTSKKTSGFTTDSYGLAKPVGSPAEEHKWLTGLFDSLNKENTKHYVQEIFEIAGFTFNGEEYILEVQEKFKTFAVDSTKKIIGLNTGCGGRWVSRLYSVENWSVVARELLHLGYEVVLLGGQQEDERNKAIQENSGAKYFGYFNLEQFIALMDQCDIIVSAVTMGMHIAIALQKPLVLFNNIFNTNEFYLYNRGEILEPNPRCDCYFTPTCPHDSMQRITPESVVTAIKKLV